MIELYNQRKNVELRSINKRRPTTFAIIDDRILLWQINQFGLDKEMEIYGMFIVEDPQQILIKHFREEFDGHWRMGHPVKLKDRPE